jgi:signal transduction histidine kinase
MTSWSEFGTRWLPAAGALRIPRLRDPRTRPTVQDEGREKEAARQAFVATASHELRTPLTSLSLMLDLLVEALHTTPVAIEEARALAKSADEQATRLNALAGHLLDVSRIDADLPLRTERVDLGALVQIEVAELWLQAEASGRHLEVALDPAAVAMGHAESIAQILRNVLDNALRHSRGTVRARGEASNGMARVVVEDDGPGVPAHERERIFQRFERGANATNGGCGLGLAIGRELARRMDGDLVLDDTAAGARFVLLLPATPAP